MEKDIVFESIRAWNSDFLLEADLMAFAKKLGEKNIKSVVSSVKLSLKKADANRVSKALKIIPKVPLDKAKFIARKYIDDFPKREAIASKALKGKVPDKFQRPLAFSLAVATGDEQELREQIRKLEVKRETMSWISFIFYASALVVLVVEKVVIIGGFATIPLLTLKIILVLIAISFIFDALAQTYSDKEIEVLKKSKDME